MGFISSLFGGPQQQQQSQSQNVNNGLITSDYGGQVANGTTADNYLTSMLTGTGNTGAANAGYSNYLQQAGYAPAMKQLSQNITGQGAAAGLLDSGSTTKALQSSGAALNNQFYNNYLQQLGGLSSQGTQAGSLIAGTGQQSSSSGSGSNNGGLFGGVGSLLGGVAMLSDRRLKTNIKKIGEESDGLGIYEFEYGVRPSEKHIGVMADEVSDLRPWALGDKFLGFQTVNYGAL